MTLSFDSQSPRLVQVEGGRKFWDKFRYNPISDISFDYYEDGILEFRKTIFKFCNEPSTMYYSSEVVGSSDSWYINPVADIKRVLPANLHSKIFYFYDTLGTLILLKGNFNEFPMSEIRRYFDVEILSDNKFALCPTTHSAYKARVFAYLENAASKV